MNSSSGYDYDEWNRTGRQQAAQQINEGHASPAGGARRSSSSQPDVRVVTPVGGALVFSGAQLHSTVPNTTERTRFSIDFRTVNVDDLESGNAAPNVDSECTGTTLGDFRRASDLEPLPEELIDRYREGAAACFRTGLTASTTLPSELRRRLAPDGYQSTVRAALLRGGSCRPAEEPCAVLGIDVDLLLEGRSGSAP